ncbi:hypothetical protein CHS0354_030741 [Potamilus streckersoni]|uniref:Uncharacterized protein n=1 Tax=Potamilus streckersoni TaxID=2493646 RepID=A0AAE0RLB9_9BIVA|nr:hypothetical protein CHS0354_030741 [Potamilus streckersoni]
MFWYKDTSNVRISYEFKTLLPGETDPEIKCCHSRFRYAKSRRHIAALIGNAINSKSYIFALSVAWIHSVEVSNTHWSWDPITYVLSKAD